MVWLPGRGAEYLQYDPIRQAGRYYSDAGSPDGI